MSMDGMVYFGIKGAPLAFNHGLSSRPSEGLIRVLNGAVVVH